MHELFAILKDLAVGALPISALGGFVWWKITHSRKHTEQE